MFLQESFSEILDVRENAFCWVKKQRKDKGKIRRKSIKLFKLKHYQMLSLEQSLS